MALAVHGGSHGAFVCTGYSGPQYEGDGGRGRGWQGHPTLRCNPWAHGAALQIGALGNRVELRSLALSSRHIEERGGGRGSVLIGQDSLPGSKTPLEFIEKKNEGNFGQPR